VSHFLPFAIETLVSILLLVTIGYCTLLNRRLKRFKADEQSLKATISELITATEIAERAIGGLKVTVRDCDKTLGERLHSAERFVADIDRQVAAGEQILHRISQIAAAARPEGVPEPAPESHATAVVKAAQAFADRTRSRVNGLAA
jgi:chromosome segregation ATPase